MTSAAEQLRVSRSRTRPWITLVALILFVTLAVLRLWPSGEQGASSARVAGSAMGTVWRAKIVAPDLTTSRTAEINEAIAAVLEDVEARMSLFRPESELSLFNRAPADQGVPLSPSILEVLAVAKRVHGESGGAFDPTVAPLVAAWGFGASTRAAVPSTEELTALLSRVGFDKILLEGEEARKSAPDLTCDLSGIAKGYAVDQVAARLSDMGFEDFMIEVGGEIRTRGENEQGLPFRIAVERPDDVGQTVFEVLGLSDLSIATSGDYRNFRMENGERISHTIDPRSGHPIAHSLASVSVVHESCVYADAMATALTVLGPEEGMALAGSLELAVLFIRREDGGFVAEATPEFNGLRVDAGEEKEN